MSFMDVFLPIILFIIGAILVIKGGDFFVDAASWIAEKSGVPKIIIGATIVSVATTMPELLVSVMAATEGKVDMSIGNAVGSVIANIGLILAIAFICMPGKIKRSSFLAKSIILIIAASVIAISGIAGSVSVIISVILLLIFIVFMVENILSVKKNNEEQEEVNEIEEEKVPTTSKVIIINIVKFVCGAAAIVLGSNLLVDNGSILATLAGVPEKIIGVTLIAVGTSLPELITTITAIVKKQSGLSIGNILGANIMDLTLIMPLAAIISGKALPIASSFAMIELPFCLFITLVAVVPTLIRSKMSRWQGVFMLVAYVGYLVVTCMIG